MSVTMLTTPAILLYGATGFSGAALARVLAKRPGGVVLAGRSAKRLAPLAEALGQPWAAFPAEGLEQAAAAFPGLRLMVNAAGPFAATAPAQMAASIRLGIDYLDLSGEWPTFEAAKRLCVRAREGGVMLLPGAAFSVAASDCLLLKASRLLPHVARLRIAFSRPHPMSRGSAASALALAGPEIMIREEGALVPRPLGAISRAFDFGEGPRMATALSWPDLVTAPETTGVGSIETYSETAPLVRASLAAQATLWPVLQAAGVPAMLRRAAGALPQQPPIGPDGGMVLVAEAEDRWRRTASLRMRTADGYSTSVRIAEAAVGRVLAGERRPGFVTPAGLFGADFMEAIGAGQVEDLPLERARA